MKLKPVGVTEDGFFLILAKRSNAKTGDYRLAIDEMLLQQLTEARKRVSVAAEVDGDGEDEDDLVHEYGLDAVEELPPPRPRVESKLSIKEIQALLRQGRSVASVAKKAGVDPSWVERFEPPIVWERAGMATRAQKAVLSRARRGPSALALGESVEANLRRRRIGLDPDELVEAWDSVRRKTGTWVVKFSYPSRGQTRTAQWEYDPETHELHAINALGADLGWVQSGRRRR